MKPRKSFILALIAVACLSLVATTPAAGQSEPHPRVIRLSFVEGNVTLQRPEIQSWAQAPANTPLEQGFKISTGENSFAEIQFENGGAIRLGERSLIDLTELALDASGGEINRVDLHQGYATFHPLASRSENSLQVETPLGAVTAHGEAEFRVDLDQNLERIEVFNGSVEEASNLGSMTVERDSVLVVQPGAPEPTAITRGITQDDWDQWVTERESRAEVAANSPAPGEYSDDSSETPYGWSDLAQNGVWTEIPGEGAGWIPSVSVDWSPYSSGQWCWYPGWGMVWIGSEPWGWLPYHYGGWEFVNGKGWVWLPGSFRRWSPGRVTWFQGPDWVGWIPSHPRHRLPNASCGNNCGGGAVSAGTFHKGGILTHTQMLGVNPTTGTSVRAPKVDPSTVTMLPGPVVTSPASQRHGFSWNSPQPQPQTGSSIAASPGSATGPRRGGTTNHNSSIVYDPQQGTYVNTRRVASPATQPASLNAPGNELAPGAATRRSHSNSMQPVPVEGHQPAVNPPNQQEPVHVNPGVYAPMRPVPTPTTPPASNANTTTAQPSSSTGQAGGNRGGGWAPAGGRTSSPPANSGGGGGGGRSAPAPAPAPSGAASGRH